MTDNEIIKAMQCVIGNDVNCSECTYQKALPFPSCRNRCAKNALDLIDRQKAEIEQWKEEANKYQNLWCIAVDDIEKVKSEVIKEFENKLLHYTYGELNNMIYLTTNELKKIVKEIKMGND